MLTELAVQELGVIERAEPSRMLARLPESERAREHAQKLPEIAGRGGR